jgi:membrane glycosyltransferase
MLDIALTPGGAARYGGRLRFAAGAVVETVFSILIAPIVAFRVTIFLIGLLFGRSMMWNGQNRDAYRLSWGDALRGLWPQTLFGLTLAGTIVVVVGPATLPWAGPMVAGLGLAIPFAVLTAHPAFGRWTQRIGLCAIPDEIEVPESIARVEAAVAQPRIEAPRAA